MLTVMDSTPSATCPVSGTTRGLCMREWQEAGGQWIRGEILRFI